MCFSARASLAAFLIGLVGAFSLISRGDTNNIVFGIFFIFISLIQLMDFVFWSGSDKANRIATMIGPLLNVGQPLIMYLIKISYFGYAPDKMFFMNSVYAAYLATMYTEFIDTGDRVTRVVKGHLKWPWIEYSNPVFYLVMFIVNALYLTDFEYSAKVTVITLFFLLVSHSYFAYHVGEIWCYFGAFIPFIIMLF